MTLSDSMFLFEIVVEKLLSYVSCREFYIKSQFADIFKLNLKYPDDMDPFNPTVKSRQKTKVRIVKNLNRKPPLEGQVQSGVSIFSGPIEKLIKAMRNFPFKASLYNKDKPKRQLGSTYVPWSPVYIDYLYGNCLKKSNTSVQVSGAYTVYNEITSKRVATIKLKIKLSLLKDKLMTSLLSLSENNQNNVTKDVPSYNNYHSIENTGVIKTVYGSGERKMKAANGFKNNKREPTVQEKYKPNRPPVQKQENILKKFEFKTCGQSLAKCDLVKNRQIELLQTNSCSNMNRKHLNTLNYIFGDSSRPVVNQTCCVNYCTVENNNLKKDSRSSKESSSQNAVDLTGKYEVGKCNCEKDREIPPPTDDSVQIDLRSTRKDCCDTSQAVEKVTGGMKAKMNFDEHDCFCTCECTFGIVKHTKYCGDCIGFLIAGEDMPKKHLTAPIPCPVYHNNNYGKGKPENIKYNTKRNKRNCDDLLKKKKSSKHQTGLDKTRASDEAMDTESEEDDSKGSKNGLERFKFNYGFTGIPARIGHSKCGLSCGETDHSPVPKDKGWLWTSKNVPGLKFRPLWRPGAALKNVVRLLKMAKNPGSVMSKKKKEKGMPKKSLKRPLLTVAKKEGEYTVTMETMKAYPKQRARNQQPFEDKPLLKYTIGRTEEENHQRRMKKERDQRRLERDKQNFLQSAFTDMCKDICLKTYQQALGILPGAEDPDCPCYPKHPGADEANLDRSCSCSDDPGLSFGSDTDSDEWLVEFTPPNALYDPTYKRKKIVKLDNSTQYCYLDYRIKVLDRYGNQVPRFFKGPDGKTQCSDLGGFWSTDHKWLKINTDGYIGPDNRWAPMVFIGPNEEQVECNTGKFQVTPQKWLVVGVDGFVDALGRWNYYAKPKAGVIPLKSRHVQVSTANNRDSGDNKNFKGTPIKPSEVIWNCLGDANPKDVTKMGILGHGNDRKLLLKVFQEQIARGENVKIPEPSLVPSSGNSKKRSKLTGSKPYDSHTYFAERERCKHVEPSGKGIIAVDGRGNKTYFRILEYTDKSPKERLAKLTHQGISLSAFHVPCLNSFINSEVMKKQLYERRMNMSMANETSIFEKSELPGNYKIYKYRDSD